MTKKATQLYNFIIQQGNLNKFAILVETEELAQLTIKLLHELGWSWDSENPEGSMLDSNGKYIINWDKNKKNTCYTLTLNPKMIFYASSKFYSKKYNREIIPIQNIVTVNMDNPLEPETEEVTEKLDDVANNAETDISENEINEEQSVVSTDERIQITENHDDTSDTIIHKEETLFCNYCGAEITSEAKFCPKCGQRIIVSKKESTQEYETVSNISSENEITPDNAHTEPLSEKETIQDVEDKDSEEEKNQNNIAIAPESFSNSTDNDNELKTKKDGNILLSILGIEANQAFKIVSDEYFNTKNIYRINPNGYREIKAGDDIWFVANDEQDLIYLINHPESIQVL